MKIIPLNELGPEESAEILSVGGRGVIKRRLLEMGIVPGNSITMVRFAPLGDPLEYKLEGCLLSLRREEAKGVMVIVKERGDE